jgi:ribosomal protein S18 acetylase RimI-like enzyme
MLLEPAAESDYPAVIDLINLAFRGAGAEASWNIESGIIAGQRMNDALLREELEKSPQANLLIHRDPADGAIVGTVWLDPKGDGIWYLGLLTVRPALQKQHLGSRLLRAAEEFVGDRGARSIKMTVVNLRQALIAWYQRRGYTLTGEAIPYPYGDNRFGTPLRDDLHFLVLEKRLAREQESPPTASP